MADTSYSELLTATVELNLSDFQAKMKSADKSIDKLKSKGAPAQVFSNVGNSMLAEAVKALNDFAEKVIVESLVEVPKHTGVLADSADVTKPYRVGGRVKVTLGYGYGDEVNEEGRTAAQYALPVHEIYDADHAEPTKDHYLLDPLLMEASRFGPGISAAMRHGAELTMIASGEGEATIIPDFIGKLVPNAVGYGGKRVFQGPGGRFIRQSK